MNQSYDELDLDQEVDRAVAKSRATGVDQQQKELLKELILKAEKANEQEFPHSEAARKAKEMIDEAYDIDIEAPPIFGRELKLYHKIDDDLDQWSPKQVQSALEKAVKELRTDDFAAFDLAMTLTGRQFVGGGHMDEEMASWIENMERVDEVFNHREPSTDRTDGLKGIVVFYIDVGQLPPQKAEAFIERIKEDNKALLDKLPSNVGTVFMPHRARPSKIEYVSFDSFDKKLKELVCRTKKRKRRRKKKENESPKPE